MFWYFYFLILVRLPAFVYILFCFGFWFWNGSTGCLQRTVEEKSLSSVRQCRWRRAWLLNSALRRVWCLALTGFLKWACILSLNWTWRLQAMSFYSSTLISLLFLSLTLYVWPWSSHLTLEGINLFIIWRKKKKPTVFYSDFFKFSCYDFGSKYHADTLIYSSKLSGFCVCVWKIYKIQTRKEFGYNTTTYYPS